jgi:hypothetical protein
MAMMPFDAYGLAIAERDEIPVRIIGVVSDGDGDFYFVCIEEFASGWCGVTNYESVRLIDNALYNFKRKEIREAAAKAADKA